ncbi:MAG: hypothetical protein HY814_14230 [Candidatus Riflebacteria bacterium]|nr:hypothetical protein [Candidatus Riflebacteria bacterium]
MARFCNSLVPVVTVFGGVANTPVLLAGRSSGIVEAWQLSAPFGFASGNVGSASVAPGVTTATQFYQRAIVCTSERQGYGESASAIGSSGQERYFRCAEPAAPVLTINVGAGAMTAGEHGFLLQCVFSDGSESPFGVVAKITVAENDAVTVTWTAGTLPTGSGVASVRVWVSAAGDPSRWRLFVSVAPDSYTSSFSLSDEFISRYPLGEIEQRFRSPKSPGLAVAYGGRLAYFGEKHRAVAGWNEGGSQGTDVGKVGGGFTNMTPGGWTLVSGSGAQCGFGYYAILFDGVTAARARIENLGTIVKDLPGIAELTATGWSGTFRVRLRVSKTAGLTSASVTFGITGTTGGTSRTVTAAEISGSETFQDFDLSCAVSSGSTDLKLFVEGAGPGVNGERIVVELVECYDPANSSHRSAVWWSRPLQARTIDRLYGGQTFGAEDGETAWLGFEWQGRFYVAKESSLWVTQRTDDEPNTWPEEKVSDLAGACGRRAICHGPDFKVLVNRLGAWLFQGTGVGPDSNLASEIRQEWEAINWAEAWQIWGAVDEEARRVYIGVPTGVSTFCNAIYVLDYSGGFGPGGPNSGRRWSVWPIEARGGCMARREGATKAELFITETGTDPVYSRIGRLDEEATTDFGTASIPFVYETGRVGAEDGALGLFRRVSVNVEGSGLLSVAVVKADGQLIPLPAPTIYTPMRGTQHLLTHVVDERVALRFGIVGTTPKAIIHRVSLWMRRNPFGTYRARTP